MQVELVDYGMNSVSQGIDAMAITRVVIRPVLSCSGVTPQVRTLAIAVAYACCVSCNLICCMCCLLSYLAELATQVSSLQLLLLDSDKLTSDQATRLALA